MMMIGLNAREDETETAVAFDGGKVLGIHNLLGLVGRQGRIRGQLIMSFFKRRQGGAAGKQSFVIS
jgi:hypothetical protein